MIAFAAMRTHRHDRVAVPMTSWAGGLVVNPSIRHRCSYGDDGSTYHADNTFNPGCYEHYCDPHNPFRGGNPCGFGGSGKINSAWHSYELRAMLELYLTHSVSPCMRVLTTAPHLPAGTTCARCSSST